MIAAPDETSRKFRWHNGCGRARSRRTLQSLMLAGFLSSLQLFSLTFDAAPQTSKRSSLDSLGFALLLRPETNSDGGELGDKDIKVEAELAKHPDDPLFLRIKAQRLAQKGEKEKAIAILTKLIKKQNETKTRYASPYMLLAFIYRKNKQHAELLPLIKEMVSRFPDHRSVLMEVQSHNRVLKNKEVASKLDVALKKIKAGRQAVDLRSITPPHPKQLKDGLCYKVLANTAGIPKFKITLLPDRCVADSGVARYFVSPPTYERIILFNPETKNYATTTVLELMRHHCSVSTNRAAEVYRSVRKIGNESVNGHACSVYKCQYFGDDNYDKIYLSDSMSVVTPLAYSISEVCQTPYSGCIPIKAFQVVEGHPFELMNVHSISEVKSEPSAYRLPEKAHRVATLNDVIFDDYMLDSFFMSK